VRHVTTLESAGIGVNRSPDGPNSAVLRTPRNPVQLAMGLGTGFGEQRNRKPA